MQPKHYVTKTVSGGYKCGPDLYCRRVEGGYECWRAENIDGHRRWHIGQITMYKEGAITWLQAWESANRGVVL